MGGYFPLDRWAEDALPPKTSRPVSPPRSWRGCRIIEASNADGRTHGSSAPVVRARGFGRRALLGNYLAAAAATLILIFANAFSIFTDMAARADRLNAGARDITIQTQRLVETRPHWLDILKNWFPRNQQSQEGGKTNAQE